MELKDLEIYQLARKISWDAWKIYEDFNWQTKKVIGDQFITAVDSIGANIAEGFGRFHYADKNKFGYNARGSLIEGIHWTELLAERGEVEQKTAEDLIMALNILGKQLNNYITATKKQIDR